MARGTALGINGPGQIYLLSSSSNPYTVTPFFNMDMNGLSTTSRTSADPATAPVYGSGTSYAVSGTGNNIINYLGAVDPLSGSPSGMGVVGTNTQRGISNTAVMYDPAAFDQVGKVGIGDIEMSDDGKFLYVTNLYQRKIFRLTLNNPYNPTAVTAIASFDIPTSVALANNGKLRPFGLKYSRGSVYVGVTSTGEDNGGTVAASSSTGGATDLNLYVFEIPNANTATAMNATPIFSQPLNYNLGHILFNGYSNYPLSGITKASPWTNNTQVSLTNSTDGTQFYPEYMLTGLEFSDRGDLLMSLSARKLFTAVGGSANLAAPTIGNHAGYGSSTSHMLVAGKNCNGSFTLENANTFTSSDGAVYTGANANFGPGGKTFFKSQATYTNGIPNSTVYRTALGALSVLKGQAEVLGTDMMPYPTGNDGRAGVSHYSTTNGARSTSVFQTTNYKYRPMGDIELVVPAAPIEIGNRIWLDTNGNGIQDADELTPGVATGTTVTLHSPGVNGIYGDSDDQFWTTTTDANGNYYFGTLSTADNRNPSAGNNILSGYDYRIEVPIPTGKYVTVLNGSSDAAIDNNAVANGANAVINTVNTTITNYTYDIGISNTPICTTPTLGTITINQVTCNGGTANSDASFVFAGITGGIKYASNAGATFTGTYAGSSTLTGGGFTVGSLPNPSGAGGQQYTFRVYGSDSSCFKDTTLVLPQKICIPASCTISAVTAVPGACVSTTNKYSLTGSVTFANAPATGKLVVKVGSDSVTFNAPFTSPQAYTIGNLVSDGASHTVVAYFTADAACTLNQNYTAPASCGTTPCGTPQCGSVTRVVKKKK